MKDFHRFMNDPRMLLWVTNQHQAAGAVHPKVLSLPLGMKNKPDRIYNEGMVKYANTKKKKLLIINNSGWKHREGVNLLVGAKFEKYGIKGNMYSVEKGKKTQVNFIFRLIESGVDLLSCVSSRTIMSKSQKLSSCSVRVVWGTTLTDTGKCY